MPRFGLVLVFLLAGCAVSQERTCELDLSAGGFVTELTHAEATYRTPAFNDYTKGSYHAAMATLLEGIRRERARTPQIRAVIAVGPLFPLWEYDVVLFQDEATGVRANFVSMSHARITWKATRLISREEFERLMETTKGATSEPANVDDATVLMVRWDGTGELARTSNADLSGEYPPSLRRAFDIIREVEDAATTTYSNGLSDDVPIYKCLPEATREPQG